MKGFEPTEEFIAAHQASVKAGRMARLAASGGTPAPEVESPPAGQQAQTKATRRNADAEHEEQKALFEWAESAAGLYPDLALMFAIPNGGKRGKATAGKLRAEGVKSGVPDILLPIPRRRFGGLFIEMKTEAGHVTRAQEWWRDALSRQGYLSVVCKGWEAARKVIEEYLKGEN